MVTLIENPLRVGLQQDRVPEPQILVIFGASGDLTQRKLVPALYQMMRERRLPLEFTLVGVARREEKRRADRAVVRVGTVLEINREWSHDFFREHMREGVEEFGSGLGSELLWEEFAKGLFYCSGDIDILPATKN